MPEPTFIKSKHIRASISVLGACNVGAMLAASNLILVLDPEDRISIQRGIALTVFGLIFFVSLSELINVAALFTPTGVKLRQKYGLGVPDIMDITNKAVSAVQALLSCLTGLVVCWWSCSRDFMKTSHYMSEAYAWFGAAYFFYDIWSMYMVHLQMNSISGLKERMQRDWNRNGDTPCTNKNKMDSSFLAYCRHEPVILLHHLFIGGFGFLVIVYLRGGLGDCVFGWVYLMELSTPFVSIRGILSRMKLKESPWYVVNGLVMLATFFMCRIVCLPYVCYLYSEVIGKPYFEAINTLPTGCKVSIAILLLPQLYWFYLMTFGAVKMLFGKSKTPVPEVADKRS